MGKGLKMEKYIRNSNTISGRLHDELVMMDPEQGKYFSLNQVATRIWDLLEAPESIEGLCAKLSAEYEVDSWQCQEEVASYIREMVGLRLLLRC